MSNHGATSLLEPNKRWFDVLLPTRQASLKELATTAVSKEAMDDLYQEAQLLLDGEVAMSKQDRRQWYMDQFQSRGTTSDKIASAAVKLSSNDFMLSLESFNTLFDAARHDTHHFEAALKALVAVWPKLLPARPLKKFVAQYFGTLPHADDATDSSARKKVLLFWYVEDMVKHTFTQFLAMCETMLRDRLSVRREAWLDGVGKLLLTVTEQKHVLMAMLVDKMGDPSGQIGHKAYHLLLAMLCESSTNQHILIPEIERMSFMKNCPPRALRFSVNVLNQFVFSKDERKLATKCVATYLALFRQLIATESLEQSVTTALIVGLKRAFPYSGNDVSNLADHLNALFILAGTGHFVQRVSALSLLQQLITKQSTVQFTDRWYRSLYQLLLVAPKQTPQAALLTGFFSMLHKAVRSDTHSERVAAFVHRLLERSLLHPEAFVCATLQLVSEVARGSPAVRFLFRPSPASSKDTKPTDEAAASSSATGFDPRHRDPKFARASKSCAWTLALLARHTHPAVVKLAVLLLFGEEAISETHPLDDLSLKNFLTMFADAKNTAVQNSNAAAPGSLEDLSNKARNSDKGVPVFRRGQHVPVLPSASDPSFINASPSHVDVAAVFVHRYAVQRQRFVDGLSQNKSGWGNSLLLETDVTPRVQHTDSLFGPTPVADRKRARAEEDVVAATATVDAAAAADGAESEVSEGRDDGSDGGLGWGGDDDDDDLEDLEGDEEEEEALGRTSKAEATVLDDEGMDFSSMLDRNTRWARTQDDAPFRGGRGGRGRGRGGFGDQQDRPPAPGRFGGGGGRGRGASRGFRGGARR